MSLAAGSKLGPYEILGQIGAGGMGEVYRAKDPRLGREVAIKVLPASFSSDADRLRRFEQEARAAGVLNHPNITAVYDIGANQSDGAPYVVQELLEGETLRSVLAGGKPSQRKALEYAAQIAHGLAAAHEKGIVHRDLKPENLFVTKDGRVKILDFGLAKLTQLEDSSSIATNLPTEAKGTEPGVVLGTLGYMSPEQVRGKPADARSDIFSFGAILYEMLSGKRAFQGDSAADTMSAILKEDPPDLSVTNQIDLAGPRAHRPPLPREEPRAALPVRPRPRLRPRNAVGNLRIEPRRPRGRRGRPVLERSCWRARPSRSPSSRFPSPATCSERGTRRPRPRRPPTGSSRSATGVSRLRASRRTARRSCSRRPGTELRSSSTRRRLEFPESKPLGFSNADLLAAVLAGRARDDSRRRAAGSSDDVRYGLPDCSVRRRAAGDPRARSPGGLGSGRPRPRRRPQHGRQGPPRVSDRQVPLRDVGMDRLAARLAGRRSHRLRRSRGVAGRPGLGRRRRPRRQEAHPLDRMGVHRGNRLAPGRARDLVHGRAGGRRP